MKLAISLGSGILLWASVVGWKDDEPRQPAVTFTEVIKPLIDKKCVNCHQKGGPAPFPLQTYAQVKKRADLCARMMLTRMMPPCNAWSDFGEFCEGGGPLTDDEAVLLQQWIFQGAPEGRASQPIEVPKPDAWRLGKPDVVLRPKFDYEVPEEGRPYWRAFVVPLGSLTGTRVRAFDVRVDQPEIVRSATVAVARNGLLGTRRALDGFNTGGSLDFDAKKYLGTWSPGYTVWQLPKGVSMTLNGDALIVQVLFLPRGRAESGNFELALYTSKDKKDIEPEWTTIGLEEFAVPAPGNIVLNPEGQVPAGAQLISVIPEARFFCTSIRMWSGEKLLFSTRRWEPYWVGAYRYEKPVDLQGETRLRAEFNYDNDIHMGRNEGRRPRPILPGYRERDELCRMHVLYYVPHRS